MFVDVSDWYDYPTRPTIRNVNRLFYNCGGYALGKLEWYWPAMNEEEQEEIHTLFHCRAYRKADELMVKNIFEDFPELVEVKKEWVKNREIDYKKFEIIAFRTAHVAYNWDFHFRKLAANGRWYEKCGNDSCFYNYSYDSIFDTWNNRYNGKIYFFARKRVSK